MNLLVISQYYYPEQFRINDICKEWVKRGHNVTVVTGIPNYPQGKFYKGYSWFKNRKEQKDGVNIIRLPIISRGKNVIRLVLNYISFVISGFFFAKFTRKKFDKVFIYEVSPMTQSYVGIWYAKRKKIECNLYVMDLWPESIELATGIKNKTILNFVGKMVDKIYKQCDRIFTSSESFIKSIEKRGQPSSKLIFWPQYAETFYKPIPKEYINISEIPENDNFKIVFAGNIGQAQGLDILVTVAKQIKQKKDKVEFYLIGDGRAKNLLIQEVKKENVQDIIHFIDKKPAIEIPKYYSACDMAFLSLKDDEISNQILPAKLQSYLACGIPILGCVDGEAKRVIEDSKAGFCVKHDSKQITETIEQILRMDKQDFHKMKKNAVNFFRNNYEKELLLEKMDKVIFERGNNNV